MFQPPSDLSVMHLMHLLILLFLLPFILLTVAYHHPSRLLGEDIHRPEEDHTADEFNGGGMD